MLDVDLSEHTRHLNLETSFFFREKFKSQFDCLIVGDSNFISVKKIQRA